MLTRATGSGGERRASYFDFVSRFASRRRFQLYQSPAAPTAAAAMRSHVVIALTSFHGGMNGMGWVAESSVV
jgi:hypothetical protein